MRSDAAIEATFWSFEFWNELAKNAASLRLEGNRAELWGWKIRLVWEDGGRRGVVYLHRDSSARQAESATRDLRTFVFATFNPRAEARLLLDRLPAVDVPRRLKHR